MTQRLKRGTRVAFDGNPDDIGTVTSWHPSWGNTDKPVGYVPVRFDNGIALFHVSRLAPFCDIAR